MNKRKVIKKVAGEFFPDYSGYMRWSWRYPKRREVKHIKRGDGSHVSNHRQVCAACSNWIHVGETYWGVPPTCHACHTRRRGKRFVPKKWRYESER